MSTILDNKKLNFTKTKKLDDLNWDSMAMLGLMSIIDEKFNKKISPNDIRKLKTLGDLDNFITKNKMNVLFIGSTSFIASLLKKKIKKNIFSITSSKKIKKYF